MTSWLFANFAGFADSADSAGSADFADSADSANSSDSTDAANFLTLSQHPLSVSYLISSKRLLFENIAHVGSFADFVFVFVFVFVFDGILWAAVLNNDNPNHKWHLWLHLMSGRGYDWFTINQAVGGGQVKSLHWRVIQRLLIIIFTIKMIIIIIAVVMVMIKASFFLPFFTEAI